MYHPAQHLAATDTPNNILTRTICRVSYYTLYTGVTLYCLVAGKDRLEVATAVVAKLED